MSHRRLDRDPKHGRDANVTAGSLPNIGNRQRSLWEHSHPGFRAKHSVAHRSRDIVTWQHFRPQHLFIRQPTMHHDLRFALNHHLHNHLPLFWFLSARIENEFKYLLKGRRMIKKPFVMAVVGHAVGAFRSDDNCPPLFYDARSGAYSFDRLAFGLPRFAPL
jgi:hypothetical protein